MLTVSKLRIKCECNALSGREPASRLGSRRPRREVLISGVLGGAPAVLFGRAFQPVVDYLTEYPLRTVLSRTLQFTGLEHLVTPLQLDREYLRGPLWIVIFL